MVTRLIRSGFGHMAKRSIRPGRDRLQRERWQWVTNLGAGDTFCVTASGVQSRPSGQIGHMANSSCRSLRNLPTSPFSLAVTPGADRSASGVTDAVAKKMAPKF